MKLVFKVSKRNCLLLYQPINMAPISYCLQCYLNTDPFHARSVGKLQPCGKDLERFERLKV